MQTLDLTAAAKFLGVHPDTLQCRAKAGLIPGAKIGKEWRFLDADLADYLRSQYPANLKLKNNPDHSTKPAKRGMPQSIVLDKTLEELLRPKRKPRR